MRFFKRIFTSIPKRKYLTFIVWFLDHTSLNARIIRKDFRFENLFSEKLEYSSGFVLYSHCCCICVCSWFILYMVSNPRQPRLQHGILQNAKRSWSIFRFLYQHPFSWWFGSIFWAYFPFKGY